jgi:hypothetical protein
LKDYGAVLIYQGPPQFEAAVAEAVGENETSPFVAAIKTISVVLKNASTKTIIGYSVNWKYDVGRSTTVRGVTYKDLERLLDDGQLKQRSQTNGSRSISLGPGSARLVSLIGSIEGTKPVPSPGYTNENIEEIQALIRNTSPIVVLDGILFDDGSFAGPDRNQLFKEAMASF